MSVNMEQLRREAAQMKGVLSQMENTRNELENLGVVMSQMWSSQSKEVFELFCNADMAQLQKGLRVLEQFVQALENCAAAYENGEEQLCM